MYTMVYIIPGGTDSVPMGMIYYHNLLLNLLLCPKVVCEVGFLLFLLFLMLKKAVGHGRKRHFRIFHCRL